MKKSTKSKKTTTKTQEKKDDYYTPEEEERLDYFHEQTGHKFQDEEVYALMVKYKNNDEAILNELNEQLESKKGEGEWVDVGKGNYIFYYIILY